MGRMKHLGTINYLDYCPSAGSVGASAGSVGAESPTTCTLLNPDALQLNVVLSNSLLAE